MRAFVISQQNKPPRLDAFVEPSAQAGARIIAVAAGGLGPTDLMRAQGFFGPLATPYVVGGEGVGRLEDGRRVYFGHSVAPFGAWAERTIVPEAEIWPLPDDIDDAQAIALGISGTGALLPLEEAHIRPGERVLILGATGPVGQIGLARAGQQPARQGDRDALKGTLTLSRGPQPSGDCDAHSSVRNPCSAMRRRTCSRRVSRVASGTPGGKAPASSSRRRCFTCRTSVAPEVAAGTPCQRSSSQPSRSPTVSIQLQMPGSRSATT